MCDTSPTGWKKACSGATHGRDIKEAVTGGNIADQPCASDQLVFYGGLVFSVASCAGLHSCEGAALHCFLLFTCTITGDSFDFFEQLKAVIELGQPLSNAIHQLEADKPLLSQLLPVFETMVRSARDWVRQHEQVRGVAMVKFHLGMSDKGIPA